MGFIYGSLGTDSISTVHITNIQYTLDLVPTTSIGRNMKFEHSQRDDIMVHAGNGSHGIFLFYVLLHRA